MNDIMHSAISYFFPEYMKLRFSNEDLGLLLEACETEILQLESERVAARDHSDSTVAIEELSRRIGRYQRARRMIEEVLNEEV